jgi:ABC-type multidrug transport system ATPase subunit
MAKTPLLEATEARIAIDGVVAIDRLTLSTHGDRVVFAGDPGPLIAALTGLPLSSLGSGRAALRRPALEWEEEELPGEAYVSAGRLLLAGRNVADGAHVAVMGAAPLDPPLPSGWTAEEYVAWGARLGGAARRAARDLAAAALGRVGLGAARRRAVSSLSTPERRALVLAQAVVLSPEVLVAEAPLEGLEGNAAAFVLEAFKGVTEGRCTLLTAARIDPGSPEGALARSADHLVVLAGGEIALEGAPSELYAGARVYSLTVHQNATALKAELAARGIDLRGGPLRFSTALSAGSSTRDLLLAAQTVKATIVELIPVIG